MKSETFYRGVPGAKYGIWNASRKEWQFGICEDTPMLAEARLFFRKLATTPKSGGLNLNSCLNKCVRRPRNVANTVLRRIKLDPCCIIPEIVIEVRVPVDCDAEDYMDAFLSSLIREDVWRNCVWEFTDYNSNVPPLGHL